jgi:hypothetical protein
MAAVKAAAAAILFIQLFRPSYQASMSGGDFDLRNSDMRSLGPALFSCYLEQPETTHSLNPKKCEPRVFLMQTIECLPIARFLTNLIEWFLAIRMLWFHLRSWQTGIRIRRKICFHLDR